MSPSEVFYLLVPLLYVSYFFVFKKKNMTSKKSKQWIKTLVFIFCLVGGVFMYLSLLMRGKVLIKEILIAVYFLCSVEIILNGLRQVIRGLALYISRFPSRKVLQRGVYVFVFFVFWAGTVLPYIIATFSIHRPKIGDRLNPYQEYNLEYETVSLKTVDHKRLHGWFIPYTESKKGVIIAHGLGANKSNFISLVHLWHGLGYNVFIFDFRGHGQSDGHTVSFGVKEKLDIRAAVDYMLSRKEVSSEYLIGYGVSFGGAAMIYAAAEDPRLQMVIIDSSFADVNVMARKLLDQMFFIPSFCRGMLTKLGMLVVQYDLGFDLSLYSPEKIVGQFENQPILIIHGKHDQLIPYSEALALFERAQDPKQLYSIEQTGHYATLCDPQYVAVIADFIQRYQ